MDDYGYEMIIYDLIEVPLRLHPKSGLVLESDNSPKNFRERFPGYFLPCSARSTGFWLHLQLFGRPAEHAVSYM